MVTIGLAVGLATLIYSVAAGVLLRPFPYADPDRLVAIWKSIENVDIVPFSIPEFVELKDGHDVFADVAGVERETFDLLGDGVAEYVDAYAATANLFDMLGVPPILGRTFRRDEGEPGRGRVIVLDEVFWRRAFAADRAVIGRRVRLAGSGAGRQGDNTYEIVGVVSSRVRLVYRLPLPVDLYVPRPIAAADVADRSAFLPRLFTFARLQRGVTRARADAAVRDLIQTAARLHPQMTGPRPGARGGALHEELVGQTRPAFVLLAAAALVVILVGCVNVAHLLLSDGIRRRNELSARLALGCSRARLLRQLLTEHALIAALGGVFGTLLAWRTTPLLVALAPSTLPRGDQVRMDAGAALFALGVTVVSAVVAGVGPAWLLTRPRVTGMTSLTPASVVASRSRLRGLLVAVETALVLALVSAGGLIADGLWRLAHVDLGFRTDGVTVVQVNLPARWASDDRSFAFERDLLARLRQVGGIAGATASSNLPFASGALYPVTLSTSVNEFTPSVVSAIDREYLSFLGVGMQTGRTLTAADRSSEVALVNQAFAKRFPDGRAIGQRIQIGRDEWREVVGVVGSITEVGQIRGQLIKLPGFTRLTLPAVYVPSGTLGDPFRFLLVRTAMSAGRVAQLVRHEIRAIDPEVTIRSIGPLDERVHAVGSDRRFYALVVLVFAGVGLILAAVGLHAVLAHTVVQRTREIGVRMALGARSARIARTIAGGLFAAVLAGVAAGVALVLAAGRVLRSLLFEVSPDDPTVLLAAISLIVAVAAAAAFLPVVRAARTDPAVALRCD